MDGLEDSVRYNTEQRFSIQIDMKQFYQYQRYDKKMVVLHPSRVDKKSYHLNQADDNAVWGKVMILKWGQENLERKNQKIRFTFKPQISSKELSYGNSNNVVIGKPTTKTFIYTYMDKETASIFQMGKTTIDDFPYYSNHRLSGTIVYLDPIRVRRMYVGYQIKTEPDEDETASMAQPTSVGYTKVVFHRITQRSCMTKLKPRT